MRVHWIHLIIKSGLYLYIRNLYNQCSVSHISLSLIIDNLLELCVSAGNSKKFFCEKLNLRFLTYKKKQYTIKDKNHPSSHAKKKSNLKPVLIQEKKSVSKKCWNNIFSIFNIDRMLCYYERDPFYFLWLVIGPLNMYPLNWTPPHPLKCILWHIRILPFKLKSYILDR